MGNKTRRRGQKRRGTRRKGGAINKLPNIPNSMTLAEFEDKYDVFYISAHGGILDTNISVPGNTYLMHSIPSTYVCKLAGDDEKLNRFYKPSSGNDDAYDEDNFMEFIRNPRIVFETIYRQDNQLVSRVFATNNNNFKRQSKITSIYEPGDEVPDVILQFYSYFVQATAEGGASHFIAPGIFKIPMSTNIKSVRDKSLDAIRRMTSEGAPRSILERELTAKDNEFIQLSGNLLGPIKKRTGKNTFRLSELLEFRELAAGRTSTGESKKRLFIIHACKSMSGIANNDRCRRRAASVNRIRDSLLFRSNIPSQISRLRAQLEEQERQKREREEQLELYQLTRGQKPRGIVSPNGLSWNNVERIYREPPSEID
jgi:hypothetical protein